MSNFKISIAVCFGIFALICLSVIGIADGDTLQMIGLFGVLLSVLYLLIGIILCIPASSREVGKGILLSSGIILVIGLSVCSQMKMNFH